MENRNCTKFLTDARANKDAPLVVVRKLKLIFFTKCREFSVLQQRRIIKYIVEEKP